LYADTLPTLQALHGAGVPVAVVSNIGFDIRPLCADLGIADYVSAWVLSYELGRCKPDPAVFLHACLRLGVEPERTLMIGDTLPTRAPWRLAVARWCCRPVRPGLTTASTWR
jgi:HAD superfamily hydrolase (TIGR01509 family)